MINLTLRQKKLLKWVGIPTLALVTFVTALFWTFPYDRLKDKLVDALSEKYDVSIESMEPGFMPGNIVLTTVMLKTRPTKPDEKPVVVVFDEIELEFGLLAAIRGRLDLEFLAETGGGIIEGNIQLSKGGMEAEIQTESLPLEKVPGVATAVGLPMAGGLNANMRLKLPNMKWKDAEGHISIDCPSCTVGDGVTRLKIKPTKKGRRAERMQAFVGEGIEVPRLNLGDATAEIKIKKGVGKIEMFHAKSKDGELSLEGEIRFTDPFKNSTFPGCMKFSLSEDLRNRGELEKKFANIEFMLPPKSKQPDGSFAIPTKGKLAALRWDVKRQCKGVAGTGGAKTSSRPSISARPDRVGEVGTQSAPVTTAAEATVTSDDSGGSDEPEVDAPGTSGPKLGPKSKLLKQRDDVGRSAKTVEGEEGDEEEEGEGEGDAEEGEEEGEEEEGEEDESGEKEEADEYE